MQATKLTNKYDLTTQAKLADPLTFAIGKRMMVIGFIFWSKLKIALLLWDIGDSLNE